MKDLTPKLQASLGRQLIDREIKAIDQHVNQYGTPKIEIRCGTRRRSSSIGCPGAAT